MDGGQRRGGRAVGRHPSAADRACQLEPGRDQRSRRHQRTAGEQRGHRHGWPGLQHERSHVRGVTARQRRRRGAVPEPPLEQARPASRPLVRDLHGWLVPDPPARIMQPPDQVDVLAVAQSRDQRGRVRPTHRPGRCGVLAAQRSAHTRPGWPGCTLAGRGPRSRLPRTAAYWRAGVLADRPA